MLTPSRRRSSHTTIPTENTSVMMWTATESGIPRSIRGPTRPATWLRAARTDERAFGSFERLAHSNRMNAQPARTTPNQRRKAMAPATPGTRQTAGRARLARDDEMKESRGHERQHLDPKRPARGGHVEAKRHEQQSGRDADAQPDNACAVGGAGDFRHGLVVRDQPASAALDTSTLPTRSVSPMR